VRWTTITFSTTPRPSTASDRLERNALAAAEAFVCGDDDFGFRVDDPVTQRFGAEAAEYDRVHGSDSSTCEHRVRELGDHGEVNTNPVTLADAKRPQCVGDTTDRGLELGEGDALVFAGLVCDEDNCRFVGVFGDVPVDTVDRRVDAASREPHELAWRVLLERGVRFVVPVELVGLLAPELFVVGEASVVEAFVFL
jgi:hypothetical protein